VAEGKGDGRSLHGEFVAVSNGTGSKQDAVGSPCFDEQAARLRLVSQPQCGACSGQAELPDWLPLKARSILPEGVVIRTAGP